MMDHILKQRALMARYAKFAEHKKWDIAEIIILGVASGAGTGYLFNWVATLKTPDVFWLFFPVFAFLGCVLSRILYKRTYFQQMEKEAIRKTVENERKWYEAFTLDRDFISAMIRATAVISGILIAYDNIDYFERVNLVQQQQSFTLEEKINQRKSEYEFQISELNQQIDFYTERNLIQLRVRPLQHKRDSLLAAKNYELSLLQQQQNNIDFASATGEHNTAAIKFLAGKSDWLYRILVMILAGIVFACIDGGFCASVRIKACADFYDSLGDEIASASLPPDLGGNPINVKGYNQVNAPVNGSVNGWLNVGEEEKIQQILARIRDGDPEMIRIHDLLSNTEMSQSQIAEKVGKTPAWISYVNKAYKRLNAGRN